MITNYLTEERISGYNVIAFIDWANSHHIDYYVYFTNPLILLFNPKRLLCYLCIKGHILRIN